MEKIVIEERESKSTKIVVVGLFMLFSIAVWIFGIKEKRILYWIIGFVATVTTGIRFLILLTRTLERKPLLTITFDGIIDSSSTSSVGYIAFQDIHRFCIAHINGQKVIGVIPKDDEAFIDKL